MIKFLRHRMKFHKLSRWHEVINQLLHLWNSRSNYPKNAEGEPKYEKSKNSCHIWQKSRVQAALWRVVMTATKRHEKRTHDDKDTICAKNSHYILVVCNSKVMLYIWGKSKFKADNQKDGWHDDDEGKKREFIEAKCFLMSHLNVCKVLKVNQR